MEVPAKEICRQSVGCDPAAVHEEAVNLVGEDVFFELDSLSTEGGGHADGLGEGYVAVVVALDEEDGGFPGFDGGEG